MPENIGLIAGSGDYPFIFAREAKKAGMNVVVVGLKGITSGELKNYASAMEFFRLGQISAPMNFFKANGVGRCVMVGSVAHISLWKGVFPDLRAAKLLLGLKDKKANSLLGLVADELAKDGIELVNSAMLLEHLLAKPGLISGRPLGEDERSWAEYGWKAAKTVSALDIGLTVVLREKVVMAVEGMEGTDACVRRAGELMEKQGIPPSKRHLMVVKVARPDQDMRFDLPVTGRATLENMKSSGADILIIEARKNLILGMEEFLSSARETGITVFAAEDFNSFKTGHK